MIDGWAIAIAAASHADRLARGARAAWCTLDAEGAMSCHADAVTHAVLSWTPGHGYALLAPLDESQRALIELYLPVCSATAARPITVGHLGQSLDGFIATHSGDSQWVTGHENIVHLHRMRALCDAVVVGAGTVAVDNPQLTTRHVTGRSPLRVVFDPSRRLDDRYDVFRNAAAETIYACPRPLLTAEDTQLGRAQVLPLDGPDTAAIAADLLRHLRARGCQRIFVEGGGVTVSAFLEADLLDRLHLAVAPLIIGDGRPAIRLTPRRALRECLRPQYRVFRMGGDVLFDCDLNTSAPAAEQSPSGSTTVARVI